MDGATLLECPQHLPVLLGTSLEGPLTPNMPTSASPVVLEGPASHLVACPYMGFV